MENNDDNSVNFYLDYVNNYLTVAKIAEHNNMDENIALAIIDIGRKLHEERIR